MADKEGKDHEILSLSQGELALLPEVRKFIFATNFVEDFVEYLKRNPYTSAFFQDLFVFPEDEKLFKQRIFSFFDDLFSDPLSKRFFDKAISVGLLHAELGISPSFIFIATNFFYNYFLKQMADKYKLDSNYSDHNNFCSFMQTTFKLLIYNLFLLLRGFFEQGRKDVERTLAELASLNRLYILLREINFLIYEERTSVKSLFQRACDLIFKLGNFSLVWIGIEENEGEKLSIYAASGNTEYLKGINIMRGDPLSSPWKDYIRVLLKGSPIIISDICKEAEKNSLLKRACEAGFKSLIVIPLFLGDQMRGLLLIYCNKPSFVNNPGVFIEISRSLSLAWTYIVNNIKLEKLLFSDDLTGLGNDRYFLNVLEKEVKIADIKNDKFAIIRIDVDNLSLINFSFGYLAGDFLIKELANRLLSVERYVNIVSRTGPDDFSLLCYFNNKKQLSNILLEIRKLLEEPYVYKDKILHITVSIGVSLFPEDGRTAQSLFEAATVALKRVQKDKQGGVAFYREEETQKFFEEFNIIKELEEAFNRKEFVLFYQPIIDLSSRQIVGLEALLRWHHPDKGLILPGQFISALENSGLIVPVGHWIFEEGVRFLGQISHKCPDIYLSLNLSVRQFKDGELIPFLRRLVREANIEPGWLQIELTERVLLECKEKNREMLQELGDLGFKIAIDDFGTGFSSMVYLKRIPAEKIKIDYSFVRGLPDSREDVEIVKAIVNMATSLGKKTVAEGVETREQLAFLTGLGVGEVQGFYFARPMGQEEIKEFIASYDPRKYFWHNENLSR